MKPMTDEEKLHYILGMLDATVGSVHNYSSEALLDRMRFLAAVIRGDEAGKAKYGRLCEQERIAKE